MSSRSRFFLTVVATTAVALAIVAVLIMLRSREPSVSQPPPTPTPTPGIAAKAREIRTVPDVSAERRKLVTKQIAKTLRGLYTRAFVREQEQPQATASPDPGPSDRIAPLLTTRARAALKKSPEVFDQAEDLSVFTGSVVFEGVITFEGTRPVEALLEIDFSGQAAPRGRNAPLAKVRQLGTVLLKQTSAGWRVDGLELRFASRPWNTPTPSPA